MPNQELHEMMMNLASKYLSGNATPEEIRELEAWVLADPENQKTFTSYKKAWMLSGLSESKEHVDVDEAWKKLSSKVFNKGEQAAETKVVPIRRFTGLRIAASLALLITAAFLIYHFVGADGATRLAATNASQSFELSDGSEVTLNQSSSLIYKEVKKTSTRLAKLDGDAYFDIERDEKSPFIIQTQNIEIEVLGTSFYVDSRKDEEEIQVIVESGSVAVRSGSDETILKPNEKAIFKKQTQELVKSVNDDPNYLSVKTNTLDFSNSSIEEVVFALNRLFNADISIEIADTTSCKITTTFKNKPLDFIVTVIEQTLGIQAVGEGKSVILSGSKCN